jgi:glycosyltransferase involved in cell wall biosynthesis
VQRVVHVTAYYPPHLGGQEVAVEELAGELAKRGRVVEVITSDAGGRRGRSSENGVQIERLRSLDVAHTPILWCLPFRLLHCTRREAIVHVHVGQAFAVDVVWFMSKVLRYRYVLQLHCDPLPSGHAGRLLPLYKKLFLPRYMRDAEAVVVLNHDHARMVKDRYSPRGRIIVMANGVGDEFFDAPREPAAAERLEALFVGRLTSHKNIPALLAAASQFADALVLHVVGDGEERAELERIVAQNHINNVVFHGRLDRDRVRRLYSRCDLLVLSSLYEAQPMVVLEAMAARIPIMATRVVTASLPIDSCAVIVEPTAESMVDGFGRFLRMSSTARADMAAAAFDRALPHRWESVIASYCELYAALSSGVR